MCFITTGVQYSIIYFSYQRQDCSFQICITIILLALLLHEFKENSNFLAFWYLVAGMYKKLILAENIYRISWHFARRNEGIKGWFLFTFF